MHKGKQRRGRWLLCAVVMATLGVMCGADHYKTLGVSKSASKSELKKAYHKLALKHHPVNILEAALKKFQVGSGVESWFGGLNDHRVV